LQDRVSAVRRTIHLVARDIDHGVVDNHRIGAVTTRAAQLGEEATILAAELLGPASLIEHLWLEKVYRDLRAFGCQVPWENEALSEPCWGPD
jgi:alkylation response protein AidB-like acyl-CoA dehydrogenase